MTSVDGFIHCYGREALSISSIQIFGVLLKFGWRGQIANLLGHPSMAHWFKSNILRWPVKEQMLLLVRTKGRCVANSDFMSPKNCTDMIRYRIWFWYNHYQFLCRLWPSIQLVFLYKLLYVISLIKRYRVSEIHSISLTYRMRIWWNW